MEVVIISNIVVYRTVSELTTAVPTHISHDFCTSSSVSFHLNYVIASALFFPLKIFNTVIEPYDMEIQYILLDK